MSHAPIDIGSAGVSTVAGERNMASIVIISIIATLGGFLFGFDSGVINGTIDGLTLSFKADASTIGSAVASILAGCAVGAFAAGALADKWGRRGVLMLPLLRS